MRKSDLPCIENCGREVGPKGGKGRCSPCNQRAKRIAYAANPTEKCSVDACDRYTKGPGDRLCLMHYDRKRKHGSVGPAQGLIRERGTGGLSSQGYMVRQLNGRRVPEHHWVVEESLGRELYPWENVHHKNGLRADNRLENLEIWIKPQPAGQRPEDLLAWCDEHRASLVEAAAWNAA